MSNGKSRMYFGGVPTSPDVKRLIDAFNAQDMKPDYEVSYSRTSDIIGCDKNSSRWRTVTMAWRRRLEKEHGIFLGCNYEKQAFCVLSDGGKVGLSGSKLRSAVTAARRSYIISGYVDVKNLSVEEKRNHDFYSIKSGNILAAAQLRMGKNTLPEITGK